MLERITVDESVRDLRPDFAVLAMTAEGPANAPGDGASAAWLARAGGDERFDVVASGEPAVEHPEPGEVVWRDDAGVTCRRWNWRECVRTRLTEDTKNALFLLERRDPYPLDRLQAAADDLAARLREISPDVRIATRLIEW